MPNSLYSDLCDVYDEGKKPYLFISYSHEDTAKVVAAIRGLQRLGYRIWYDMGISAGAQWPEDVADHIYGCDAVLAFMTPNAIQSDNCREELFYAKKCNKKILLAYLEKCDLSHGMDMRLGMLQAIERWRCKDDEEFYTRLAKAKNLQPCRGETLAVGADAVPDSAPRSKADTKTAQTKIERLLEKAQAGEAKAQCDLARAYYYGKGVTQDYTEAVKWFQQSADQGFVAAQCDLGTCYYHGHGIGKNLTKAAALYQEAAEAEDATAQCWLGICYEYGHGVKKNMDKAFALYLKSAEQGKDAAQWNLAVCYEYSKGTEQDWNRAAYWYQKAAEQRMADAQKQMATCYLKGLGVPVDKEKAEYWQKLYDENPNKK